MIRITVAMKPLFWLPCLAFGADLVAAPLPEPRVVKTDYHGVTIEDPYRYFEETGNPEVASWAKALTDETLAKLAKVPEREKILRLITETDRVQGDRVGWVQEVAQGEYYFLMRREGDEVELLFRQKPGGKPELVLDPRTIEKGDGSPVTVKHYSLSPDHKRLAVGITSGGGEDANLYVLDAESTKILEGPVDRARWGRAEWLPDSSGFFYNRLQKLEPNSDPLQKFQKSTVYYHRLGTGELADRPIFGTGVNDGVEVKPEDITFVTIQEADGWVVALNESGVSPDYILHLAKLEDVIAGKPRWRQICDRKDNVGSMRGGAFEIQGDHIYLLTRNDAPNGKLVRVDLKTLDFAKAETVFTAPRGAIQDIAAAKEGLYVRYLSGGPSKVVRLPWDAMSKPEIIGTPEEGRISLFGGNGAPRFSGLGLSLGSWTRPARNFRINGSGKAAQLLDLPQPAEPSICRDLVSRETMMPGHDGVMIPVSIVHKKDLPKDGKRPVMLSGYGAYGLNSEPGFRTSDAALFELGAIKVVAHVRGGGELGDEWRKAGFQKTKPNTWKDMISVAEGLVKEGYTAPKHICIHGGSAGGITVGRAMTEKPEAIGAVLCGVGCLDALRFENSPNGIPNLPEFGSVKTKEGFEALREMSAYEHVKPGVKYPPVLFYHGANDTRVELWQSLKMTARLLAAQGPDADVQLRVDYQLGHGSGASRKQENEQQADLLAFFFSHCR